MSIQTVDSTIVKSSDFDGTGIVFRRGASLGDKAIISGSNGAELTNITVDDANYKGVSGCMSLTGENTVFRGYKIINCIRYGMIHRKASGAWGIYDGIIDKAQHGISGATGFDGEWNPSTDGEIAYNRTKGFLIHAYKIKNQQGTKIHDNIADIGVYYPGWDSQYSKEAFTFNASDAVNRDVDLYNNKVVWAGGTKPSSSYGVNTYIDAANSPTKSSGNKIRNNEISDVKYAYHLKGLTGYSIEEGITKNVQYLLTPKTFQPFIPYSVIPPPPPPTTILFNANPDIPVYVNGVLAGKAPYSYNALPGKKISINMSSRIDMTETEQE